MGKLIDVDLLLKFGSEENMKKLLKGEVYLSTLKSFKESDDPERGDCCEGDIYIEHFDEENTSIFINDKEVKAKNIELSVSDCLNQNVFCLYAVKNEDAVRNLKDGHLIIDTRDFDAFNKNDNGASCVAIQAIPEFLKRVENSIKQMGLKYEIELVYYYENTYNGKLTPFMKRDRYSSQKEFRIWVKNTQNEPLILNIGNISDIASFIPSQSEIRVTYGKLK
ncbi:MAG: hypothetical protein PHE51_11260 [Eubacteriales bacterium]|nr:hypothetical protein [Eubacteriales bacterium]